MWLFDHFGYYMILISLNISKFIGVRFEFEKKTTIGAHRGGNQNKLLSEHHGYQGGYHKIYYK